MEIFIYIVLIFVGIYLVVGWAQRRQVKKQFKKINKIYDCDISKAEPLHSGKIAGISKKNKDGSSRQNIAEEVYAGDILIFKREPSNKHDEYAVKILTIEEDQLGYIPSDYNTQISKDLDKGKIILGQVKEKTGGKSGKYIGINYEIFDATNTKSK